jgi:GAF domain-containing protein
VDCDVPMNKILPASIKRVFAVNQTPELLLAALMPALGESLDCDRCFIYLRNPQTRMGLVPFCWIRDSSVPYIYGEDWKVEPNSLPLDDPMFAAALRTEASIIVNDVDTASTEVLNRRFELEHFGHRALIHAHICQTHQLWGVLQPCVFNIPKNWSDDERQIVEQVVSLITPYAVKYVQTHNSLAAD